MANTCLVLSTLALAFEGSIQSQPRRREPQASVELPARAGGGARNPGFRALLRPAALPPTEDGVSKNRTPVVSSTADFSAAAMTKLAESSRKRAEKY